MPDSGRYEYVDRVNTQKPDQKALSGKACQKPNQVPSQPRKQLAWQTDGTVVITNV